MKSDDRPRLRELGYEPGVLSPGDMNAMSDVPGVAVGHESIVKGAPSDENCVRTGVTIVDPDTESNLYDDPATGATHVLNGYGKSVGLPQVDELGEIETPIGLTNTLDVWTIANAIAGRVLTENPSATSVNPLVGECNDGILNDIRGRHAREENVDAAFRAMSESDTAEGCVGAGVGTTGFGWKAGIGTASRCVKGCVVGALVLTNTGKSDDLRIDGLKVNDYATESNEAEYAGGSIMMLVGTDASLSARQLSRVTKRSTLGLGRVGGIAHHGSGDFAIGFANRRGESFADADLTPMFRAAIEATEEAIYNSLLRANTTTGVENTTVEAIPVSAVQRAHDTRAANK